jgi:hypothetical protein
MPTVSPGETFYDKLPDGRYERCVLQPTTKDTPDRKAAARGGTGEFYRAVPVEGRLTREQIEGDNEIIFDVTIGPFGKFVILERE